ncbi:MAG: MptD family putative ECF transporter S component [Treponema sp.]|jgi:energy-coupling factor transport system substrate-specific component|nr:MptD family putative ECF transporter S component [Treponema sp.]
MGEKKKGLRARDLITTGIFTALFIIVTFVFAMVLSGMPILTLFITSAGGLVSGTFFLYLAVKVGKFGAVTLMSFLVSLFMFLAGHFWPCLIFGAIFGLGADFLCGLGGYKKFWWNVAGYVVMILGLSLDGYTPMLFFADAFVASRAQMGMSPEYVERILDITRGPLLIGAFGVAAICAVMGACIGRLLLRKHFEKAGIL